MSVIPPSSTPPHEGKRQALTAGTQHARGVIDQRPTFAPGPGCRHSGRGGAGQLAAACEFQADAAPREARRELEIERSGGQCTQPNASRRPYAKDHRAGGCGGRGGLLTWLGRRVRGRGGFRGRCGLGDHGRSGGVARSIHPPQSG